MNEPVLAISALRAGYGKKTIVHGVDMDLAASEVLLVLGHNGAGKTTLMRAVFGLIAPTAGSVLYCGEDLTSATPAVKVARGLAFVPQGHGVFPHLTVRTNLELGAFSVRERAGLQRQIDSVCELFPVLAERSAQSAGTLSGGQQQMLAIGMALMHSPRVLILDEPSIGLAPALVENVMTAIRRINSELGTSILMVEQNVRYSLPIADRCLVIKTGTKVYDGPPQPLTDQVELMKFF